MGWFRMTLRAVLLLTLCLGWGVQASQGAVRIKDLSRVDGVRENALIGYGIVVGLAGSGDSPRSKMTMQSVRNTLESFGVLVDSKEVASRNAASVIVTAALPPFAQAGDRLDVVVSSMGDAKSLRGGTLYMTPLKGADDKIYALAQGSLTVGGFRFDSNENVVARNHTTVGMIPLGATVERELPASGEEAVGSFNLVLNEPDFITAERMVQAINASSEYRAKAVHAGKVEVTPQAQGSYVGHIARVQAIMLQPDLPARVVINEKTGTVVAGADIYISSVVISHSGLNLTIDTQYKISQPGDLVLLGESGVRTQVVPDTRMTVDGDQEALYASDKGTSIADLVAALKSMKLSTRDIISILQALKKNGALHAEIVVQ